MSVVDPGGPVVGGGVGSGTVIDPTFPGTGSETPIPALPDVRLRCTLEIGPLLNTCTLSIGDVW